MNCSPIVPLVANDEPNVSLIQTTRLVRLLLTLHRSGLAIDDPGDETSATHHSKQEMAPIKGAVLHLVAGAGFELVTPAFGDQNPVW